MKLSGLLAVLICATVAGSMATPYPSIRCQGRLVGLGSSMDFVTRYCGRARRSPPRTITTHFHARTVYYRSRYLRRKKRSRSATRKLIYSVETYALKGAGGKLHGSSSLHDALRYVGSGGRSTGRLKALGDLSIERTAELPKRLRTRVSLERLRRRKRSRHHYHESWDCRRQTKRLEHWTYDRGPTRFVRKLTFLNGRLSKIALSGYGKGK